MLKFLFNAMFLLPLGFLCNWLILLHLLCHSCWRMVSHVSHTCGCKWLLSLNYFQQPMKRHFFSPNFSKGRSLSIDVGQGQCLSLTPRWCCSATVCACWRPGTWTHATCVFVPRLGMTSTRAQRCTHTYFICIAIVDNENINLSWNRLWRKCRVVPIGTQ